MKIILFIFSIGCLFTSCAQKSIFGTYVLSEPGNYVKLILKPEGKFDYVLEQEMLQRKTSGNWMAFKDTVYLNSDIVWTSGNGIVKEEFRQGIKGNKIHFFDFDCKRKYNRLSVLINDSLNFEIDSTGTLELDFPLTSLYLKFLDTYQFYYQKKDQKANTLYVCLQGVSDIEVFFIKEKFFFKKRMLVSDRWKVWELSKENK